MRIDIKETKVYPFDELSDEAKKIVLEKLWNINVDYEWWDNVFEEIESFAEEQNKKVIFTEIGYDVSNKAASEPWVSQRSSEDQARRLQETCLKIALSRTAGSEYLSGIFLWKWFPETQKFHHYEDYNLQTPEIKDLIKRMWQ